MFVLLWAFSFYPFGVCILIGVFIKSQGLSWQRFRIFLGYSGYCQIEHMIYTYRSTQKVWEIGTLWTEYGLGRRPSRDHKPVRLHSEVCKGEEHARVVSGYAKW